MLTEDFIAVLDARIAQLQGMRAAVTRQKLQPTSISVEIQSLIREAATLLSAASGCTDSWTRQRDALLQRALPLLASGQATAGQQTGKGKA